MNRSVTQFEEKIVHGNHFENDGYMYRFCSSPSGTYKSHIHTCYEFIYITEGCCIYTIEGQGYFVMSGDIIFTRPGEMHSFSFPEPCTFSRHFMHIYPGFISEMPKLSQAFQNKQNCKKHFISSFIVEKYKLNRIFENLKQYSDISDPETEMIAYACAIELMAKTMKIMRSENTDEQRTIPNENIYKVMQYINSHFQEDITLDMISDTVGLSKYHMSRLFKKNVGMTLSAYINMSRIRAAKNLLIKGKKAKDIFKECGFNDYSNFYRVFVKFVGVSPDEFKKSTRI